MPNGRQIEFPKEQRHHPLVTPVILLTCLICIVVTVILVAADIDGPFIGPWG